MTRKHLMRNPGEMWLCTLQGVCAAPVCFVQLGEKRGNGNREGRLEEDGEGGRNEREGVEKGSEEGLKFRRRYIDKGGDNLSNCMYFGGFPGSYTPTA